jgi:hypothetical protein
MKIVYLLLLLSFILSSPLVAAQVPPAQAPQQQRPAITEGIAMLGFEKGLSNIPIQGTTLSVHADESLWVVAKQDVSVSFGPKGQQSRVQQVRQGSDLQLTFPAIACCGNTQEFELTVTAGTRSEKANIVFVGEERLNDMDASVSVNPLGIEIVPKSSAKTAIRHIALVKPGSEEVSVQGFHGTVKYHNVIKPGTALKILYSPPPLTDPTNTRAFFVIESPRMYTNQGTNIAISKNGTVAVVSGNLSVSSDLAVELGVPQAGSVGSGGDTPLRLGLNYLHIYIAEQNGEVKIYAYLPLLVLEDDNFTILDFTNSRSGVSLPLSGKPPINLAVFASTATNGLTTAIASKNIALPVSRISVTDGKSPITEYTVSVEPDVPKTNVGGTTYLLSTQTDLTVTLTKIKVSNFTLTDFRTNSSGSNTIKFPQDIQVITKVQQLRIDATDEFGGNVIAASFKVRKNDEQFGGSLLMTQRLLLPSGTYTLDVSVDGVLVQTQTVSIDSTPQSVSLVINRLSSADRWMTTAILGEVVAVVVVALLLVSKNRKSATDEGLYDSDTPLKHVD